MLLFPLSLPRPSRSFASPWIPSMHIRGLELSQFREVSQPASRLSQRQPINNHSHKRSRPCALIPSNRSVFLLSLTSNCYLHIDLDFPKHLFSLSLIQGRHRLPLPHIMDDPNNGSPTAGASWTDRELICATRSSYSAALSSIWPPFLEYKFTWKCCHLHLPSPAPELSSAYGKCRYILRLGWTGPHPTPHWGPPTRLRHRLAPSSSPSFPTSAPQNGTPSLGNNDNPSPSLSTQKECLLGMESSVTTSYSAARRP